MKLIQKVKKTIDRHGMLDEGDTVVVALSGGADSCALLTVMTDLEPAYHLKIIVAHLNHALRGEESDFEEGFCRCLAGKNGLPFETERMSSASVPRGMSPEDYYRKERYGFLDRVAAKYQANKVALGHHLDDQAETVLLNLLRGSGMEGLKGILPVRDKRFIRPLIDVSRQEIVDYLHERGLEYCNDSTNQSSSFLRNRIRLELMPFLKKDFNPRIEQGLARMAQMINRDHECLDGYVREILHSEKIHKSEDMMSFPVDFLIQLPESIKFRFVKSVLEEMTEEGKGIYFTHIQSVCDLVQDRPSGKQISLPQGLEAVKQYQNILIKKKKNADKKDYQYSLFIPGTVDLKERGIIISARFGRLDEIDFSQNSTAYLDPDKLEGRLILRNRRPGDWFEPLGTCGRQKIKKLFIDHKIPRQERNSRAILADDVSVIWVEGLHLSDRVKISPETSRVAVVEIKSWGDAQ